MINKVILLGHAGSDPEAKKTSGSDLCKVSVATSKSWKDKDDNWQEKTEWHNVIGWGPVARAMNKSIKKGSKVYIEGEINTTKYEDKNGQTKYMTQIVARTFRTLDKKEPKEDTPF